MIADCFVESMKLLSFNSVSSGKPSNSDIKSNRFCCMFLSIGNGTAWKIPVHNLQFATQVFDCGRAWFSFKMHLVFYLYLHVDVVRYIYGSQCHWLWCYQYSGKRKKIHYESATSFGTTLRLVGRQIFDNIETFATAD